MRLLAKSADKITTPIQLIALLAFLSAAILAAAYAMRDFREPLIWAGVVVAALFVLAVVLGLTRFRGQLLADESYLKDQQRQKSVFEDFSPEAVDTSAESVVDWRQVEQEREETYKRNEGIFLVHTWRPSLVEGQVADVVVQLTQHGRGPLSSGEVASVEYTLGPRFDTHTLVKTNRENNFALDLSMYGPMLCVARVAFNDGRPPLTLKRYINFEMPDPQE